MQCHLLQMTSQQSPSRNFAFIADQLRQLGKQANGALIVLPEACLHFGQGQRWHTDAEADLDGHWQQQLGALARQYRCYLVAGTLPIAADDGRAYASSCLFAPSGQRLGRYDKVHLFDADVGDGSTYRESKDTHPGSSYLLVETDIARIGMAVCYDVRFGEQFQQLAQAGADVIVVPSAFTATTGAAHWQPLLQARAIENQCFIAAANQWGDHPDGRATWGQSMLIDPWGNIIEQRLKGEGWVSAELPLATIAAVRQRMPVMQHHRQAMVERVKEES